VGQRAPDFALADANGKTVALSDMLKGNRAVLLIFYRGYW
jgi:peroxiredoxin